MRATNEFRESSLKMWADSLAGLFPKGVPASHTWADVASMSSVLSRVSSQPNSNHMFYPTGGGMDLEKVSPYLEEPGCLALQTGMRVAEVVKPSVLLFESCGADPEWSYFRLECQPLPTSGVYEASQESSSEEVVLISPGKYVPRSAWDEGEYGGERLPDTAQLIVRSIGGGPLVIFAKGSLYNLASGRGFDAYDAQHAKMNAAEFRDYIEKFAKAAHK